MFKPLTLKKFNFNCIEPKNFLRYDSFMSLVPILANGFKLKPSLADLERRNAVATQQSLLGLGVYTRVRRLEDESLEVVVFRCTREFCTRTHYICDEELCRLVEEDVQNRVASLHALQELEKTHVLFEEGFRKLV